MSSMDVSTPIVVKIAYNGSHKKLKLPLSDLGPASLIPKLRFILDIPADKHVFFERFSDSHNSYMSLDPTNHSNYKSLQRAAKAKLKLRLRAFDDAARPVDLMAAAAAAPTAMSVPYARLLLRQKQSVRSSLNTLAMDPTFSASEATLNNPSGGVRVSGPSTAPLLDIDQSVPMASNFDTRTHIFEELAKNIREHQGLAENTREPQELSIRPKPAPQQENMPAAAHPEFTGMTGWSVYCNSCEDLIANEHYHCGTCENGDYDICTKCVAANKHCNNAFHWLIKRTVEDGKVMSSTTERIAPKMKMEPSAAVKIEDEVKMPGAFIDEKKPEPEIEVAAGSDAAVEQPKEATRTCNMCVQVFEEAAFVHCEVCEDFDLCIPCLTSQKHCHHPGHEFKPAVAGTQIGPLATFVAASGRNVRHYAICDNCNTNIYGIRHKCTECPDWDYCANCIGQAPTNHPGHRFAAIYDPMTLQPTHLPHHSGIYCDGPLCNGSGSYIHGVRYKCAICHDTDFCANCEASPQNKHNRTHPMIKFKTPVKNVSVTTLGEDKNGDVKATMGDNVPVNTALAVCTRPHSVAFANTVSKAQPIIDVKPTEPVPGKALKEKIEIKDLLAEPISDKIKVKDLLSLPAAVDAKTKAVELNAHFIRDTIADGTKMTPGWSFLQTWTLKNPGPNVWPAGCKVCFIGGDNMANATSNVIGRPVAVGEEAHFRVLMRAGMVEGTSISYWRLKTPDGTPFGHRLWCHVDVKAATVDAAAPIGARVSTVAAAHGLGSTLSAVAPGYASAIARARDSAESQQRLMDEFRSKRTSTIDLILKQEQELLGIREAQLQRQSMVELSSRYKAAAIASPNASIASGAASAVAPFLTKAMPPAQSTVAGASSTTSDMRTIPSALERLERLKATRARAEQLQKMSMRWTDKARSDLDHLKAVNAARLAAMSTSKIENAKSMNVTKTVAPPKATVEDAVEVEEKVADKVASAPAAGPMPVPSNLPRMPPFEELHAGLTQMQREALQRQLAARQYQREAMQLARQMGKAKAVKPQPQPQSQQQAVVAPAVPAVIPAPAPVALRSTLDLDLDTIVKKLAVVQQQESDGVEGKQQKKSVMIFPKLEKESPASSTQSLQSPKKQESESESEASTEVTVVVESAPASPVVTMTETIETEEADVSFDDGESVELLDANDASDSDDGFLTDEEYDILDASDEEFA